MILKRIAFPAAILVAAQAALAAISMTVSVKDGDTVSGDVLFDVKVQSEVLVTSVEFYVGDDLRNTDESTPYQFKIDSLEEKDGALKVTFAAYNSSGESVKKTLSVNVDNGMSKGVDFHVAIADDMIIQSKFDAAIKSAKIALKIDPANNKARMAMARANYGKGIFDVAQKFAEDVASSDPKNLDAKAILSAISLRRAFSAGGSDLAATAASVRTSLKSAAKSHHEAMEARADAFGAVTDENRMAYIDLMLKSHRYSTVISMLKDKVEAEAKNTPLMNRLLYAYVRAGRILEAAKTLRYLEKNGVIDGYTYALKSVLLQYAGEQAASEDAEKEAILEDPSAPATKYTQAYLALVRGRIDVLSSHVSALQRMDATSPLTTYYLSTRYYLTRDFEETKKFFEASLLGDPGSYDMMVEKGNQIIESVYSMNLAGNTKKATLDLAQAYFEAALEARPESYEALTGLSLVNALSGNTADALRLGRAAVAASQEYAPAYFALASAVRMARTTNTSAELRAEAETIQKAYEGMDRRLKGRLTPAPEQAWQYFYTFGRVPVIPAPAVAERGG